MTYLAAAIPVHINYELEHITARKIITDSPVSKKVFGGNIGNCMYLPKPDNDKKKYKNLYEVNDDGRYDRLIANSEHPTREELDSIVDAIDAKQPDEANPHILHRAEMVGRCLAEALLHTGPC